MTKGRLKKRIDVAIGLNAVLILASAMMMGQVAPPPCTDTASPVGAGAAALRPPDVLLAISRPRAGEMVAETQPDDSITVMVDYWGPRLAAARVAHNIDDYHLAFLLDMDAAPYIGTLAPTPRCTASIVHSATGSATFDHVMRGPHTVSVLLVGSNDISVNPPVAASISFVATGAT
jgi:hypothetical protein